MTKICQNYARLTSYTYDKIVIESMTSDDTKNEKIIKIFLRLLLLERNIMSLNSSLSSSLNSFE